MPQQEGTAQILKIVLIGGDADYPHCSKCDIVAAWLKQKGLTSEKRLINYADRVHTEFRRIAKERGDLEAPLICIEDEQGNLELFAVGVAMMNRLKLYAREKDLQEARQKELVNV